MSDRLNQQALTLEEAQNEIRLAVKDAYFKQTGSISLRDKVDKIIKRALVRINIPSLREAARRSLVQYYYTQRQAVTRISPTVLVLYISLLKLTDTSSEYTKQITASKAARVVEDDITLHEIIQKGVPLQRYAGDVFKEYIKPVLDDMAKAEALDPDSEEFWGRRSSLRSRAEREARHQWQLDNISDLRAKGTKLVIISAHADCSDRCRPFQGRVFSLDGTSGTAPDGRHYQPLENATDIYTPNGKWKNGLFGFNCRHYAVAYKDGYSFPTVSIKTERREYAITERQRALERNVRKWKARAEMYKGTDRAKYKEAKAKARQWQGFYENYSRAHDRAYYPSILKLLSNDKSAQLTKIDFNDIINKFHITDEQFGKKLGRHAKDYNLDPSNIEDRDEFKSIIYDTIKNSEEVRLGFWRGQSNDVLFFIKNNDVVIVKQNGEFVSILEGGVNNPRVKNARVKKI